MFERPAGAMTSNVGVRVGDSAHVRRALRSTAAAEGRSGSDRSLQVARGRGYDCHGRSDPLATGLPRDGDEVVRLRN